MTRAKPKFNYILLILIFSILWQEAASAETGYISDILIVSLRNGPGESFTSLKAMRTGESFEIFEEQNKFIKVKTEQGIVGWLPKQYTMQSPPNFLVVKKLKDKINRLTVLNEDLSKQRDDLSSQLTSAGEDILKLKKTISLSQSDDQSEVKRLTNELSSMTEKYNSFLAENSNDLKSLEDLKKLRIENKNLKDKSDILEGKYSELNDRTKLYWFLAGSGVFLLGWLTAKISLRRQKRSLSL